jgi:hypothetical protein
VAALPPLEPQEAIVKQQFKALPGWSVILAALLTSLAALPAGAADADLAIAGQSAVVSPARALFGTAQSDSSTLAQLRGGSDLVANDMKLRGTVAGNVASDVVSGANVISTGAFANVSGIPIVIQNSGANVLIQNATIINLQMR